MMKISPKTNELLSLANQIQPLLRKVKILKTEVQPEELASLRVSDLISIFDVIDSSSRGKMLEKIVRVRLAADCLHRDSHGDLRIDGKQIELKYTHSENGNVVWKQIRVADKVAYTIFVENRDYQFRVYKATQKQLQTYMSNHKCSPSRGSTKNERNISWTQDFDDLFYDPQITDALNRTISLDKAYELGRPEDCDIFAEID